MCFDIDYIYFLYWLCLWWIMSCPLVLQWLSVAYFHLKYLQPIWWMNEFSSRCFLNIHANTSLLQGVREGRDWGVVAAGYTAQLNVEHFPLTRLNPPALLSHALASKSNRLQKWHISHVPVSCWLWKAVCVSYWFSSSVPEPCRILFS